MVCNISIESPSAVTTVTPPTTGLHQSSRLTRKRRRISTMILNVAMCGRFHRGFHALALSSSSSFSNSVFRRGDSYRRLQRLPNNRIVVQQISTYRIRRSYLTSISRLSSSNNDGTFDDLMDNMDELLQTELQRVDNQSQNSSNNYTNDNSKQKQQRGYKWKTVDWDKLSSTIESDDDGKSIASSPVEQHTINGRKVYIKRDDLLRLPGSNISGNKARKMLSLNHIPINEFPSCVVSYGGPQSNAMLALAAIVNYKNREFQQNEYGDSTESNRKIQFIYYTKKIPKFLRQNPSGNFFRAKTLGMRLVEVTKEEYNNLFVNEWGGDPNPPLGFRLPTDSSDGAIDIGNNDAAVWVPQGGAYGPMAIAGAKQQAKEIYTFWKNEIRNDKMKGRKGLTVCVPGGTCTSALLLHYEIRKLLSTSTGSSHSMDIQVVVVPCVGDDAYARRQMISLSSQISGADGGGSSVDEQKIPTILAPTPPFLDDNDEDDNDSASSSSSDNGYFTFAEPNKTILQTFDMLRKNHDIVVDLLYGAPSWTIMLRHWKSKQFSSFGPRSTSSANNMLEFDPQRPLASDREIMYVHSGGLEGINSQLLRYKYKGLVSIQDIQIP